MDGWMELTLSKVLYKPVLDWTNIDTFKVLYFTLLELNWHCWLFCVYHLQISFQKVNKSSSHYQKTKITSLKRRSGWGWASIQQQRRLSEGHITGEITTIRAVTHTKCQKMLLNEFLLDGAVRWGRGDITACTTTSTVAQTANNSIDLSKWRKIDIMLLIERCLNHLLIK